MSQFIKLRGDEKVLVIRTDRIGDLVLTTPLVQVLKQNYPRLKFSALVSDYSQPILELNPYLDEVITYSTADRNTFFKTLPPKHFALAILVYHRFRLVCLPYRAGIP